MSEPRRYEPVPKQGETMSTSVAAKEAFDCLNAGTKREFRGWGDTKTAARDRAAKLAGVSPSQAERLWKNWKTMKYPNGDVYRLLRNKYGHLCAWIENAAEQMDRERREIEERDEISTGHPHVVARVATAAQSKEAGVK